MNNTTRKKSLGYVGMYLTKDLLEKVDAEAVKTTLNRSQIIRLAIIDYLKKDK